MEHDEQADRLEQQADKMEEESERVGGEIEDTRADWESKEQDASVPGAQPDDGVQPLPDDGNEEEEGEEESA
jgi:hypothetical protein